MYAIYHSRNLDGYCSGAIIKKKYPDAILIGFDYGQGIEKLLGLIPEMCSIIMADVSLPMPDMLTLLDYSGDLTWIDHHASAIKDYNAFTWPDYAETRFKAVLEDGISACEGTWKYLFPDEQLPIPVMYLGEYDTWRNQNQEHWDQNIMPFQFGMRLDTDSADRFPQYLLESNYEKVAHDIYDIKKVGFAILRYQHSQNNISMRGSFEIDFMGHVAICCNAGGFNSQAFDSVYDPEKHDIMMPFKFNGKSWTFSMYTTKDNVDCSVLAKQMGGGGHKKAAGFQVTTLPGFIFTDIYDLLLQTTRNLGHPAYGQSTATTMAIDELREKSFDYLGIPKA